jgi:predicted DNA helicase|nr:MAG TPA: DnaB-like replicative helicase [Caudoviricetes sp.]
MDNLTFLKSKIETLKPADQVKLYEYVLGASVEAAKSAAKELEFNMMIDYHDEIEFRMKNWGKIMGLHTGNWVLDRMTMGLAPGELTVIGGATSNGKTALSMNIAANVAKQGKSVLFVTLEMTHGEAGVRFRKILGEEQYLNTAANIFFQKNDELSWKSIDGLVRKAKEEAECELVVIDHLHYFTREVQNVADELGNITKELKKNAIRHQLPIILISHTRKAPDSHTRKTGINDLRGSSYIAQDADIVLMVERNLKEFPNDIIVTLEKNRNRYGCKVGTSYHFEFRELKVIEPSRNDRFGT